METSSIKVGVSEIQPFVVNKNGQWGGFEIELWNKIKNRIGKESTFVEYKFKDLLRVLEKGEIDVAFAAISLTPERETKIDFSNRTFDSGLHILVPNHNKTSFGNAIKSVFTKDIGRILLTVISFIVIVAHVMWYIERNSGGTLGGRYSIGIFNSISWVLGMVATTGSDYSPITIIGRILSMLVVLTGLGIFGLYTGQISSSLTLSKLKSNISSKDDLRGKRVATVEHTTSVNVLEELHATVVPVPVINDAYVKLDRGEVDAVVFDAPVLLYYANNSGKNKVTVVGGLFAKNDYAFALQENSQLREPINRAILELYENGEYQHLFKKWFGEDY